MAEERQASGENVSFVDTSLPPIPRRLLLGPGPSCVPPEVYQAISAPIVGHLDPAFLRIMDENQELLRRLFQTGNSLTIPISGTGSAGMEASVANLVEDGDRVLVGVNGVFGQRLRDMAERLGGDVRTVEVPWGRPLDLEELGRSIRSFAPKVVAVVHAETSTGVLQPIRPVGELAREVGALLLVDTVTSLGGHPVEVDSWGGDIVYSATQKCLSIPPGLAPITVSDRARDAIGRRRSRPRSWYLDFGLLTSYWGSDRVYHHTAPISLNYALNVGLKLTLGEGLEARYARHEANHRALVDGIEAMGLKMFVDPPHRLWSLNAVSVPEGVDEAAVRRALLDEFEIEVGAGLGPLKGKIWRVGLMGYSSTGESVRRLLSALEILLERQGFHVPRGAGLRAAEGILGGPSGGP